MVRYPDGRCPDCGEREFARADGSQWCPNCDRVRALADQSAAERGQVRSDD